MRMVPVLGLLLSACSVLPVPIDLLPYLGPNRSGTQSFQVPSGDYAFEGMKLPDGEGYPADFTQANVPVRIGYASLEWALDAALQGPQVAGTLTAQLYLAPYDAQDPFRPEYRLGDPVTVEVVTGRAASLSGSATLNAAQLSALNAKKLRLGVEVSGRMSVERGGTLTLSYTVTRAVLKVGLF